MRTARCPRFGKFSLSKIALVLFGFLAATAITSPAQTLTTLYGFCSQPNCADGAAPYGGLVQGTDGNLYGTTEAGGNSSSCNFTGGCGTIFKTTPSGALTTLHSFGISDGDYPVAGLVQGTDGNFYGTTTGGGVAFLGTVFRITPNGALTTLYSFCSQPHCTDGYDPNAGLVQATDGNFYGTTALGGASPSGEGTVFRITPGGALTTLHSFSGTDGYGPMAALVQGTDGNFYGTTSSGGTNDDGTVFKITPGGTLTTLYSFCSQTNCTDGAFPEASLVQATDGVFYGTTEAAGADRSGTVFKITPTGILTTLYSFCSLSNCADGTGLGAGLVQASDGNFYGTTQDGGAHGGGTLFEITPSGTLTTLYNFCSQLNCTDGYASFAGLLQATNGNFYGTTSEGGTNQLGTVFSLSGPRPTPVQFVPATPCRLVDTRTDHDPIQGGTYRDFDIPQLGGCNIPTTALAYSLNPTVVPHGPLGYLTIWPAGKAQPNVATMNSPDGRVKANAAIVAAGANHSVSAYATDTTDLVLDIDGYFTAPSSQTLEFYPLTPCRLVDTRGAHGPLGGPRLAAQRERDFPLLTDTTCIPAGLHPAAYSLNFAAVPNPAGQGLGYLTVWPKGDRQPIVSTLNNPTATVVANAAIVGAGQSGEIAVYPYNTTDLVIDINGYFAAPGTGGYSYYPVAPCRVLDTRDNHGPPFSYTLNPPVNVPDSPCAPPLAKAYVFNATVVPRGSLGYLTLWPNSEPKPGVATLNAYDGFITGNMAVVPSINGSIDAYAYGTTWLILDLSGYFAP